MENEEDEWAPNLVDLVKLVEQQGGIGLRNLKRHQVTEIYTKDATYKMVVVDQKKGLVAITSDGEHIIAPELWYLIGSTWGSSVIKQDFVGVDMRLEMQLPDSRKMLQSMFIETIKIRDDQEQADALVAEAKESRLMRTSRLYRIFRWCAELLSFQPLGK